MQIKDIILCHRCFTPHKRRRLGVNEEARCVRCDALLYRDTHGLEYKIFSYALSALIFLVLANLYPIVGIEMGGLQSSVTLLAAIEDLFNQGFVVISCFSLLVLLVFPALLMLLFLLFGYLSIMKKYPLLAKDVLILIGVLRRWSMLDIFFVAILVAMVKIYQYANIEFGVAFWSLAIVVLLEIRLVERIRPYELWEVWERCFAIS